MMILHIILLMILVSKVFFYALHLISKHAEWLWKLNLSVTRIIKTYLFFIFKKACICNSILLRNGTHNNIFTKSWLGQREIKILIQQVTQITHKKITVRATITSYNDSHNDVHKRCIAMHYCFLSDLKSTNTIDFCNLDPTQKLVWIILNSIM